MQYREAAVLSRRLQWVRKTVKILHNFVNVTLANYSQNELPPPPARLILTPTVHQYAEHIGYRIGAAIEVTTYENPRERQSRQRVRRSHQQQQHARTIVEAPNAQASDTITIESDEEDTAGPSPTIVEAPNATIVDVQMPNEYKYKMKCVALVWVDERVSAI